MEAFLKLFGLEPINQDKLLLCFKLEAKEWKNQYVQSPHPDSPPPAWQPQVCVLRSPELLTNKYNLSLQAP